MATSTSHHTISCYDTAPLPTIEPWARPSFILENIPPKRDQRTGNAKPANTLACALRTGVLQNRDVQVCLVVFTTRNKDLRQFSGPENRFCKTPVISEILRKMVRKSSTIPENRSDASGRQGEGETRRSTEARSFSASPRPPIAPSISLFGSGSAGLGNTQEMIYPGKVDR